MSARALMFMGYGVTEAIARVRAARGQYALSNSGFVRWLYAEAGERVPRSEGLSDRDRGQTAASTPDPSIADG